MNTCPSIEWKYGVFSCPQTRSILTESGKYMTGILDIRDHLIARSGSVTEVSDGTLGKSWNQTGSIDLTRVALLDGILYSHNSSTLTPQDPKGEKISLPLDQIIHISSL